MSVETAWEKWGPFFKALMMIVLGAIGVVTGEFWSPRARRSARGPVARIFGGVFLAFGTFTLICWIIAVTDATPDPSDSAAPKSKGVGRSRKRKPRPIDPDEEIAAKHLGLDLDGRNDAEGTAPPPIP